jgi:hypothetical protein
MSREDAPRAAVAAVTAWLGEDDLGRTIAADAIDRDPTGFLDAMANLWVIVADVIAETGTQEHPARRLPQVQQIIRDVALGIAQAEVE